MSTLEVSDDVAEKIQQEAEAKGLTIDEYLRSLLPEQKLEPELTPQERARRWREWVDSHKSKGPHLPAEAISRESIYTREDEML